MSDFRELFLQIKRLLWLKATGSFAPVWVGLGVGGVVGG